MRDLVALPERAATVIRLDNPQATLIEPLSERELEILDLIALGLSNQQIATRLVLSMATVKWHASNIYGKLGVESRVAAATTAHSLGLAGQPPGPDDGSD